MPKPVSPCQLMECIVLSPFLLPEALRAWAACAWIGAPLMGHGNRDRNRHGKSDFGTMLRAELGTSDGS